MADGRRMGGPESGGRSVPGPPGLGPLAVGGSRTGRAGVGTPSPGPETLETGGPRPPRAGRAGRVMTAGGWAGRAGGDGGRLGGAKRAAAAAGWGNYEEGWREGGRGWADVVWACPSLREGRPPFGVGPLALRPADRRCAPPCGPPHAAGFGRLAGAPVLRAALPSASRGGVWAGWARRPAVRLTRGALGGWRAHRRCAPPCGPPHAAGSGRLGAPTRRAASRGGRRRRLVEVRGPGASFRAPRRARS
jgi:hypothetical protein